MNVHAHMGASGPRQLQALLRGVAGEVSLTRPPCFALPRMQDHRHDGAPLDLWNRPGSRLCRRPPAAAAAIASSCCAAAAAGIRAAPPPGSQREPHHGRGGGWHRPACSGGSGRVGRPRPTAPPHRRAPGPRGAPCCLRGPPCRHRSRRIGIGIVGKRHRRRSGRGQRPARAGPAVRPFHRAALRGSAAAQPRGGGAGQRLVPRGHARAGRRRGGHGRRGGGRGQRPNPTAATVHEGQRLGWNGRVLQVHGWGVNG